MINDLIETMFSKINAGNEKMGIESFNEGLKREWDDFCLASDDAWFWHTSQWFDYQTSYQTERNTKNHSFVLKHDGRIVACSPLFVEEYQVDDNFAFYGFDSFEGLPVSKVDIDPIYWQHGNYNASMQKVVNSLKTNGTDFNRTKLFKGFFSKDLFDEFKKKEKFLPVSICVIDSDMYESCKEVLDFIKDSLVVGSIILFDDYNVFEKDDNHGERKAFSEFKKNNPTFKIEHIFDFGWHGSAFIIKN